jgi:prevent-host-death family protein
MSIAKRFRPISYLKTNTADVAKELAEESGTIVITQNGVPSFVCVSFEEYYQMQETNALLKLISLGEREIRRGEYKTLSDARADLDRRILAKRAQSRAKG